MARKTAGGFYAVRTGRRPGVYTTWDEARAQVDGFPNARHQKFPSRREAEAFVRPALASMYIRGPGEAGSSVTRDRERSPPAREPSTSSAGSYETMAPAPEDRQSLSAFNRSRPPTLAKGRIKQPSSSSTPTTLLQGSSSIDHDHRSSRHNDVGNTEGQSSRSRPRNPDGEMDLPPLSVSDDVVLEEDMYSSSRGSHLPSREDVHLRTDRNRLGDQDNLHASSSRSQLYDRSPHDEGQLSSSRSSGQCRDQDQYIPTRHDNRSGNEGKHTGSDDHARNGQEAPILRIFVDGASRGNGRSEARAGYGVYFDDANLQHLNESARITGPNQTNNRGELTAILRAIEVSPGEYRLVIHSDSAYSISCIEDWQSSWRRNGWKTAAGKPVENRDLIEKIEVAMQSRRTGRPTLVKVKGHSGQQDGNAKADKLATLGADLPDVAERGYVGTSFFLER